MEAFPRCAPKGGTGQPARLRRAIHSSIVPFNFRLISNTHPMRSCTQMCTLQSLSSHF
jgi:hypothetical protein